YPFSKSGSFSATWALLAQQITRSARKGSKILEFIIRSFRFFTQYRTSFKMSSGHLPMALNWRLGRKPKIRYDENLNFFLPGASFLLKDDPFPEFIDIALGRLEHIGKAVTGLYHGTHFRIGQARDRIEDPDQGKGRQD